MIDQSQALHDLLDLLALPAGSGEESAVVEHLVRRLTSWGVAGRQMQTDDAHRQSEYGGSTGNFIVRFDPPPAARHEHRLLLVAHMDTVQMAKGARPRVEGRLVRNEAPGGALGGDDRTGCAWPLRPPAAIPPR